MPKLLWSPEYELGLEVIDNQHQRIVNYINDIYDLADNAESQDQLKQVLNNLVDYTLSHFAFEESLMEEALYADLQEHQLVHQNFSHLIEGLQQRFNQGEAIAHELATLLQEWLIKHIMTEDVAYVGIVKENLLGIPPEKHQSWVQSQLKKYFQYYHN